MFMPNIYTVFSSLFERQLTYNAKEILTMLYAIDVIVTVSIVGFLVEIEVKVPQEVSVVIDIEGAGVFTGKKTIFILTPPVVTVKFMAENKKYLQAHNIKGYSKTNICSLTCGENKLVSEELPEFTYEFCKYYGC